MIKTSNIKPLTDFVRNSKAHIRRLQKTEAPEVLTVNGEAAVVVQDAASYERMAALAEQAKQDARLQAALKYFREGGEGIEAADVLNSLDEKYQ